MKIFIVSFILFLIILVSYVLFNYLIMRNVKTPNYKVIRKYENIEIREYSPMILAEVKVSGGREDAARQGFKVLADFIFGNNHTSSLNSEKIKMSAPVLQQPAQKIAMTAPVLQSELDGNEWMIKFVMPQNYSLITLPQPNNKNIHIIETPRKKMIAIQFSGTASVKNLQEHQAELEQYILKEKIKTQGEFEYAFYNPPWTLPAKRRNEVLVEIQ